MPRFGKKSQFLLKKQSQIEWQPFVITINTRCTTVLFLNRSLLLSFVHPNYRFFPALKNALVLFCFQWNCARGSKVKWKQNGRAQKAPWTRFVQTKTDGLMIKRVFTSYITPKNILTRKIWRRRWSLLACQSNVSISMFF